MRAAVWIVMGLAVLEYGCTSSACGGEKDHEIVTQERGKTDLESGIYASTEWNSNWDDFPGGRTIIFKHGLGVVPEFVKTYVSFKNVGVVDDASAAENAGNQGLIQCVDQNAIRVSNDTCSELYIRLVAMASKTGDVANAGEGGTPLNDCTHIDPR